MAAGKGLEGLSPPWDLFLCAYPRAWDSELYEQAAAPGHEHPGCPLCAESSNSQVAGHVCATWMSRSAAAWPCWHPHHSHLGLHAGTWGSCGHWVSLVSQEHGGTRVRGRLRTISTCSCLVMGVSCEVVMGHSAGVMSTPHRQASSTACCPAGTVTGSHLAPTAAELQLSASCAFSLRYSFPPRSSPN